MANNIIAPEAEVSEFPQQDTFNNDDMSIVEDEKEEN